MPMPWDWWLAKNTKIKEERLSQGDVRLAFQTCFPGIIVHMDDRGGYLIPTTCEIEDWLKKDTTYLMATIGKPGFRCVEYTINAYNNLLLYQAKQRMRTHWAVGMIRMSKMADNPKITPNDGHRMLAALTASGIFLLEPQQKSCYRIAVPKKDAGDWIEIA